MAMLLGNPNLVGTFIACFLDNTVPGKYVSAFLYKNVITKSVDLCKLMEVIVYHQFYPNCFLQQKYVLTCFLDDLGIYLTSDWSTLIQTEKMHPVPKQTLL